MADAAAAAPGGANGPPAAEGSSGSVTFAPADGAGLPAPLRAGSGGSRGGAAEPGPFSGPASFSLGPVDVHAGGLVRRAAVRQRFELTPRLAATAGAAYDFGTGRVGPLASLVYRLDDCAKSKSRLELTDSRLLARKVWELQIKNATVGVAAECSLAFKDERGKLAGSLRPDLHLSLDHVSPLRYELLGIGLVLLANLPLSLTNKEVEAPLPAGLRRLRGFVRGSVKRAGYGRWRLGVGEASGILDL
ncbi:hypothetical protein HT031_004571 [Scenedesmus sp. PABB004]|nr:hypothetical protein HT031_004571 [Scenedesmus sp. PABB004]